MVVVRARARACGGPGRTGAPPREWVCCAAGQGMGQRCSSCGSSAKGPPIDKSIEVPEPAAPPGKRPLPRGKRFHFFICHHQGSGGDQANNLCLQLKERGYIVWYDNKMPTEKRNLEGMKAGVKESVCILLFHSGRKETDRRPDPAGQYESPFTRWFCNEEMNAAYEAGLGFVGVCEDMEEHGKPNRLLEKRRALTGGEDGGPVSPHADRNLRLLDELCFIPFERQSHLVEAMLDEIARLYHAWDYNYPVPETRTPRKQEPGAQPEPEPERATASAGSLDGLCRTNSRREHRPREKYYSERVLVRRKICDWALSPATPQGCLVLGEPGTGKTTLMTELTEDRKDSFQSAVLATHFCEACKTESLNPAAFVRNITKQLYLTATAYKELVDTNQSICDKVARLMRGGKGPSGNDGEEPDTDPLDDFIDCVLSPLKQAYPESPPASGHVLIVDSLDEAMLYRKGSTLAPKKGVVFLLKTCHTKRLFPGWLKVLATTRVEKEVMEPHFGNWRRIENRASDGEIRVFINKRLADPEGRLLTQAGGTPSPLDMSSDFNCSREAGRHFERLVTQSAGTFLYCQFALDAIESESNSLKDIHLFPLGLGDMFHHFFERHFGDPGSEEYRRVRPVFVRPNRPSCHLVVFNACHNWQVSEQEAIAASDGGVPKELLLQCLRLADPGARHGVLTERLRSVRQFLQDADGPLLAPVGVRQATTGAECGVCRGDMRLEQSVRHYCDMCGVRQHASLIFLASHKCALPLSVSTGGWNGISVLPWM